LFTRTLLSVAPIDPGFETKNLSVVQFRFGAPGSRDYDEIGAAQFQRELQERLLATPPVKDTVWVGHAPLMDEPFEGDRDVSIYWPDDGSASIATVNGRPGMAVWFPGQALASHPPSPHLLFPPLRPL